MPFRQYPKIHRLGSDENDGILIGKCYIQEKVDGANTSIWLEECQIKCGSRTQLLGGGFNGFYDYVQAHVGITKLLNEHPNYRLYGEWLVRHTISYKETAYKQFYLFDIFDESTNENLLTEKVEAIAKEYGILYPQIFGVIKNPTLESIMTHVGQSSLGDKGEGVVIKNFEFKNKFGDVAYAKIVTQNFKEDNAIVFGGNNKYSETYWEMYVVNKYMTIARIEKVMNKIQPMVDEKLDRRHTARIINTAYHDLITEEIWEIQKKVQEINFKKLSILATRKAARMYHDILDNSLSVAYAKGDNN